MIVRLLPVALLLSACSAPAPQNYLYPSPRSQELERVCIQVLERGTRRFMVEDSGAVIPLQESGSGRLPEFRTSLAPGGYFCGTFDTRAVSCSQGKRQNLDGSTCSYSR
jgi:hypothetical protein